MNIKNKHHGFTLIELMIVVAIIGVLAALAIPAYQDYVAKSQTSRAMSEAGNIKNDVEHCLLNGTFTLGNGINECAIHATGSTLMTGASQNPSMTLAAGTGVAQVAPDPLNSTPTITATFGNAATATLTGQTLTWARTATGTWTCSTSAPTRFAPKSCPGT